MTQLQQPKSMKELVYFTRRKLLPNGKVKVWVFRKECPKCEKDFMHKPLNPKTGKFKLRAKEYVCSECDYSQEAEEYEDTLTANIEYTCPKCGKSGAIQVPFQRKKVTILDEKTGKKKRVDAVSFNCEHCGHQINVTKKMK